MRHLILLPLVALLATAADRPMGYLTPGTVDLIAVLPAAPVKGDIRYKTDRKVYRALGRQIGSPRWNLALNDVGSSVPEVMKDFSCAAGVTLSPEATPATFKLLANANADTSRENNVAKDHYKRLRPFLIDKGEICDKAKDIAASYDYPSGHSTRGWTFGLVLAELLPDRATPILVRARSYGESRLICRVHNMTAVEAGRTGATITVSFIRATPAYQADLAAARDELAKARSAPAPATETCSTEQALTAQSVLNGLKP
jgi:acid phosphatase (class A)